MSNPDQSRSSNDKSESTIEERVASPCVHICCLDEQDVCLGCHRTGEEICNWGAMSNDERRNVFKKVAERERVAGNFMKL